MTGSNTGDIGFEKLFASIDAMDTESFLGFIHEDATFRFGSSPAVKGRAEIGAAVGGFFSSFAALNTICSASLLTAMPSSAKAK